MNTTVSSKDSAKRVFVTGASGFIGSNVVDRLLRDGKDVIGWDNLSTGRSEFLRESAGNTRFKFVQGDCLDLPELTRAMASCDFVFHFAANADVRFGLEHPSKDLNQNTIATFNVLEAMRSNGITGIAFSSTGSVYGEAAVIPTPEDAPFPVQTSLYGASKLAGEALIAAYCEGFGFEGYIFRFVSILGERYTHGHVFDFYRQLQSDPHHLRVLGDGMQRKSYLYISDCVDAMMAVTDRRSAFSAKHHVEIYNLGTTEYIQVNDSIRFLCEALQIRPRIEYAGGDRGWAGDNPFIFLDTQKIQATGWSARVSIQEGIMRTLRWLRNNHWALERQ